MGNSLKISTQINHSKQCKGCRGLTANGCIFGYSTANSQTIGYYPFFWCPKPLTKEVNEWMIERYGEPEYPDDWTYTEKEQQMCLRRLIS